MTSKMLLALLASMMAVSLAGCTSKGADAAVEFEGEGVGVDTDSADCGDEGTIVGTGNVDEGEVTVRVFNGAEELYEETFRGEIALDGEAMDGESGDWTLEATRSGDGNIGEEIAGSFDGEYTFRLDC